MRTLALTTLAFSYFVGCSSEQERVVSSFSYYPSLAKHVRKADKLIVYEGLPHPMDAERFEAELKRADSIEIDGHRFYESPIPVGGESTERLRALCMQESLFRSFGDPKACGGFHPDWLLVWSTSGDEVNVHLCFGCGEVAAFAIGQRQMLCEMQEQEPFERALQPLRTNLPEGE